MKSINNPSCHILKIIQQARKNELYKELVDGDAKKVNLLLNDILLRSISYFDNLESFYHGFLVGLLNDYEVVSNRESGNGRFDLCVFDI